MHGRVREAGRQAGREVQPANGQEPGRGYSLGLGHTAKSPSSYLHGDPVKSQSRAFEVIHDVHFRPSFLLSTLLASDVDTGVIPQSLPTPHVCIHSDTINTYLSRATRMMV